MLEKRDQGILLMICNHCKRIQEKIINVNYDQFVCNIDLQEIVSFNILQIGELAKKLSDDFVLEYNQIPWKRIKGMRDKIVHGYDTMDLEIIWNTANINIEELNNYCKEILMTGV